MNRPRLSQSAENVFFYVYSLVAAPVLTPYLRAAVSAHGTVPFAGWAILTVLVLETPAMWWLSCLWRLEGGLPAASGMSMRLGSALVISHALLAYFMLFAAVDMLGLMGGEGEQPSALMPVLFVALFFREIALWIGAAVKRNVRKPPAAVLVALGRFSILLFQCAAFTVYWNVVLHFEGLPNMPPWGWLILAPVVVLLFTIVYLPMRAAELLEPCFREGQPGPPAGTGRRVVLSSAWLALYPFAWEYVKTFL